MIYYRIPNNILCTGVLIGIFLAMRDSHLEVLFFFIRMIITGFIAFPVFRVGMIGAGDIKLIAWLLGLMGMGRGSIIVFFGFFIGAIWVLIKHLKSGYLFNRMVILISYVSKSIKTNQWDQYYDVKNDGYQMTIPLGACISIAAIFDICIRWNGRGI